MTSIMRWQPDQEGFQITSVTGNTGRFYFTGTLVIAWTAASQGNEVFR